VKVSIVVPVYNAAPFLREALDSVIAQTHADWECLCIDDGSDDGSLEILNEYAGRDGRFKVRSQKNAGVSAARNAGLEMASGEFVAFLDPDDLFHPQCLALALEAAQTKPNAVVVWNWRRDGVREFMARRYDSCGAIRAIESCGPCVWNKLYPRAAVEGVRFCVGATVAEDIAFLLKVSHLRRAQFAQIEPELYWYRERSGSAMHRALHVRDFVARSAVVEDMMETLSDDGAAREKFCRENLPGLLKQFLRHLRQVVPEDRRACEREFARELGALRERGLLKPQRGSFKDLKYYLKFLLMSRRCA